MYYILQTYIFWVNFCVWVKWEPRYYFVCIKMSNYILAPLFEKKKKTFPAGLALHLWPQKAINLISISELSILFRWPICLSLCQNRIVLVAISLWYVLKEVVKSYNMFLFFKIILVILGSLHFHTNFKISFNYYSPPLSPQKACWNCC